MTDQIGWAWLSPSDRLAKWRQQLRQARAARGRRDRGGRGGREVNEARNRSRGIRAIPAHRGGWTR